eukprot:TRINITY_DN4016_c0_g1_i2.p1 TRINITY_DN4016_c0_g1~~TRINITY_DN4016_c0_g1_i2.p1  ORF type:complete len:136 (-),score=17.95 TRINITY_DN4016_c0_g1_i2:112-519(-)
MCIRDSLHSIFEKYAEDGILNKERLFLFGEDRNLFGFIISKESFLRTAKLISSIDMRRDSKSPYEDSLLLDENQFLELMTAVALTLIGPEDNLTFADRINYLINFLEGDKQNRTPRQTGKSVLSHISRVSNVSFV